MKLPLAGALLFVTILGSYSMASAKVTIIGMGKAQSVIYVAAETMLPDKKVTAAEGDLAFNRERDRQILRDSVGDLATYLGIMSGAKVEVLTSQKQSSDKRVPIWIGELASRMFGAPMKKSPYKQGWRVVISDKGVGLIGESDESTSYAIYELLDRLGCRWFMPGTLGESIPVCKTIALAESDISGVPATIYRYIWYADDAFRRRNRQAGVYLNASHALEFYITKEQRQQHPEWRAMIDGKPHEMRLKWSNPEVSNAVADAIIAKLDQHYVPTISLSPEDGADFDESDDTAWDTGDWDASLGEKSITDRYVKFCNLIVERVNRKYPDVLFGFLAYVQYTRPPLREIPHPNLIPQIAPISYCRAHAMTDTHICKSRPQIRSILEGWAKVSPRVSLYNYMFHLAEVSVPYPMMHQMSKEQAIVYANNVKLWQPETLPNFDSVLPGLYLTVRKSWYTDTPSGAILDEFFARFYGAAQKPMRRYWQRFDDAWIESPEHSGSHLSYLTRFTPAMLRSARADIEAAQNAARTADEKQRVQLQVDALAQFELYMKMRRDLAEGRLSNLSIDGNSWLSRQIALGEKYSANYAFGKVPWTPHTVAGHYYKAFHEATYQDASRIARDFNVIAAPLRNWKYTIDREKRGEALSWHKLQLNDRDWKVTDVGTETWSALGLDGYMGIMWYRHTLQTGPLSAGKKTYLWVSSSDGKLKAYVNGVPLNYTNEKGESALEYSGFSMPVSYDITHALKANASNDIVIVANRDFVNELGSGGLLSPVYVYQEK